VIPGERITGKIYMIMVWKDLLGRDLVERYGVETKVLKQAVRRNKQRFPKDFIFELNPDELRNWRSQFVTSNKEKVRGTKRLCGSC